MEVVDERLKQREIPFNEDEKIVESRFFTYSEFSVDGIQRSLILIQAVLFPVVVFVISFLSVVVVVVLSSVPVFEKFGFGGGAGGGDKTFLFTIPSSSFKVPPTFVIRISADT